MKQLTQSEFKRNGKIYKNISSPATSGTQNQITDFVVDNGILKQSTDGGSTFVDVKTKQGNDLQGQVEVITSEFNKKLENNSVLFTIAIDKWQDLAGKEPYKFSATIDCNYSIKTTGEPVYELINNNPVNFANYGFALINVDFGTSSTIYVTPKFTFYAMEKPTESVNLRVLITATSVELIAQDGGIIL